MTARETNVLVVDDHRLGRQLLVAHLERVGYRTLTAEHGIAALEILEADSGRNVDVILLDRRMPRMDGMELLKRLKRDSRFSDIPVIMQTAMSSREEVIEGIRAGAYYYLTKPFEPEVMLSITASAVEDRNRYLMLREEVAKHTSGLALLVSGTFVLRTLEEADTLAVTLALACPDSGSRVGGLSELLINAIEHGNLGITYEEKDTLLAGQNWHQEIARRLALAEHRDKRVTVEFTREDRRIDIVITDQGQGFDWRKYMELDPGRAFHTHGRGIALARALSFDDIEYRGDGNQVAATIRLGEAARPSGCDPAQSL